MTSFLLPGKTGDLILMFPAFKAIYERTGIKPKVIVSRQYASVFDGISYAEPVIFDGDWMDIPKAVAFANSQVGLAIMPKWWDDKKPDETKGNLILRVHGNEWAVDQTKWPDYMTSMYERCGFSREEMMSLPLVFDRRNATRENHLVKTFTAAHKKPMLLLSFTGQASPFPLVPEIMRYITPFANRLNIVSLDNFRAQRVYDLVGLMDKSIGMITIDTSTMHLAQASNTPYIALTRDGWSGSVPRGNCSLNIKYSVAAQRASEIPGIIEGWISGKLSVHSDVTANPESRPETGAMQRRMDAKCWMVKTPKVVLLYTYIASPSEPQNPVDFESVHRRFVDTYKKFRPKIPHVLMPVIYRGPKDAKAVEMFSGLNTQFAYYPESQNGFDIGAYIHVGSTLDCDLVVGMNSQCHFYKEGWLERLVEAYQQHPKSIFSPWGSYERSPHLRGPCMAFPPWLIRKYPHHIASRESCYKAESGEWNLTKWAQQQGYGTWMVTWDEILGEADWRNPANCFRRGDQSDCIMLERHSEVYRNADAPTKQMLSRGADGGTLRPSAPKTITVVAVTSLAPNSHAIAIDKTVALIPHPCRKLLIAPRKPNLWDGEWVSIPDKMPGGKWTLNAMCRFLLHDLHAHIHTDLAVVVQWDGYAINGGKWTDRFLDFDYIGAPWPAHFRFHTPTRRVGNGGFSLRSKRWLQACANLPELPGDTAEDVYTSVNHASALEQQGLKIAPLDVAIRWSTEYRLAEYPHWKIGDSFGFHGLTDHDPSRSLLRLNKNE